MEGKTARGASSPAKPALHMPEPLSTTRAATSSSHILLFLLLLLKLAWDRLDLLVEIDVVSRDGQAFIPSTTICRWDVKVAKARGGVRSVGRGLLTMPKYGDFVCDRVDPSLLLQP